MKVELQTLLEYKNGLEAAAEDATKAVSRKNEKLHWLQAQTKQYELVVQTLQE